MPGGKKPGPSVKDDRTYEAVRRQGASKEKAARIANASAGQGEKNVSRRGGKHQSYDDWSKNDLMDKARQIGIKGRSSMTKDQLVKALRDH